MKSSILFLCLAICLTVPVRFSQAQAADPQNGNGQQAAAGNSGGSRIYGVVSLANDDIQEGITTTEHSLALQPEVGYQWAHARIGVWGSNVEYPSNAESLNLRPLGWFDAVFSQGVDLKLELQLSEYFKSSNRNANLYTLDFNYNSNHFIFMYDTNWFGTGTASDHFEYHRAWKIPWNFDYELSLNYDSVTAIGYNSYLSVLTGVGYRYAGIYTEVLINYNGSSSQFPPGIADNAIFVRVTANF